MAPGSLNFSTKLVHWNQSEDCCSWNGVECDVSGHVISLQLDGERISGGIEDSRYLFNLTYLQKLNLADNNFYKIQIPKGLSNLANLTHLNLSENYFMGQIPAEVLNLKKLVSLDLSQNYRDMKLENPDLKMLAQNLTELEELYLDGVDISTRGNDWFQVLSSSLPDLRILSLRGCELSGPIGSSLLRLRSLSVLRLDDNYYLNSTVPDFLANLSTLTTLNLSYCSLFGSFPHKIFEMPSLQILYVSYNRELSGMLPNFSKEGSLRTIRLSYTNFSGPLPDSISNLTMLSTLDLGYCSFSGPIPRAIGNLTELTYLDISRNSFIGNIPSSLFTLPSLQKLYLDSNEFTGSIPESIGNMTQLESLNLSRNKLTGKIPVELENLTFLTFLNLSYNELSGKIPTGGQFYTFEATCFEGNVGLCGFPTNIRCNKEEGGVSLNGERSESNEEIDWNYIFPVLGFALGLGVTMWLLFDCEKLKEIYFGKVDQILLKLFPRKW